MAEAQDPLEGFPELRVEDGVDDGVDAGVDVPEQGGGLEGEVARGGVDVELDAESIENVAGEERNPA